MLKIEKYKKYQKGYECMKNAENAHQRHTFSHEHPLKNHSKQIVLQFMHQPLARKKKKISKKLQEKENKNTSSQNKEISSQTETSFKKSFK